MAIQANTPAFTSPKGRFQYPALVTPNYGMKAYTRKKGQYQVNLILPHDEAKKLIAVLDPYYRAALAEGEDRFKKLSAQQRRKLRKIKAGSLCTEEQDYNNEAPTGNSIFTFSTSLTGTNSEDEDGPQIMPLFDAGCKPVKLATVEDGTIGKVSFTLFPYFLAGQGMAGLKLYLKAVQIIELAENVIQDAASYGFVPEQGYQSGANDNNEDTSGHLPMPHKAALLSQQIGINIGFKGHDEVYLERLKSNVLEISSKEKDMWLYGKPHSTDTSSLRC